ncbi:MAG: hypothetical protein QOF89_5167 [Acidobacteriota bacterium]|jgi:hypothetical protein|nr:hypothetical protein [Acidobacteriota bacterium]
MKKGLKKLTLNRETLRMLDPDHLRQAAGGVVVGTDNSCNGQYTCNETVCGTCSCGKQSCAGPCVVADGTQS